MSIRMNLRIEQAFLDIAEMKNRLQALEKAYSERPQPVSNGDLEIPSFAKTGVPRETKVDKRTKAYREQKQ